jgi:hypothetical protein
MLARLGITQKVKPKLKPRRQALVVGPVARGEVEIGIISIPFIVARDFLRPMIPSAAD